MNATESFSSGSVSVDIIPGYSNDFNLHRFFNSQKPDSIGKIIWRLLKVDLPYPLTTLGTVCADPIVLYYCVRNTVTSHHCNSKNCILFMGG